MITFSTSFAEAPHAFAPKQVSRPEYAELRREGNSPAILLIHGFSGSPWDLRPLADSLASDGIAYEAPVLAGHGTKPSDMRSIKMEQWRDEVLAAYDSLHDHYDRISVVGFSLGGVLALLVAEQRPVEKLVLIEPYFGVSTSRYPLPGIDRIAPYVGAIFPYLPKFGIKTINDPEGKRRYVCYNALTIAAIPQLLRASDLARSQVDRIVAPTLWIHSTGDTVADFVLSRKTFDRLKASQKQFVEFSRSDHVLLYDYEAGDALSQIMTFLKESNRE